MSKYLDLLPESRKEEIRKKKNFRVIIKQELLFLMPVAIFLVVLFSIKMILGINIEALEKTVNIGNGGSKVQNLESYKEEFGKFNEKISYALDYRDEHLKWTNFIESIEEVIGDSIKVSKISTREYEIFISGSAEKREDLISFQQDLLDSECYEEVNIPLSNLVNKENVSFQMDLRIKKECLISN